MSDLILKEGDLLRYKGIDGPTMVVVHLFESYKNTVRVKWFDAGKRMTTEELRISDLLECIGNVYDEPNGADLPQEPPKFAEGDTVQLKALHRSSPVMAVVYPRTPAGVQVTWFDASHRPVFEHYPESMLAAADY